jgi:hypothetical protein
VFKIPDEEEVTENCPYVSSDSEKYELKEKAQL